MAKQIRLQDVASGGCAAGRGLAGDLRAHFWRYRESVSPPFSDAKNANPKRVATFQLIKSVTLATILLLVVEKLMRRITVLEHANKSMVELLAELTKALSED